MTDSSPRFDVNVLRRLAGDGAFARGGPYHRDGRVELLAIDVRRVLAQVAGTEDYRTEVTGRGAKIGGRCSCPAFEDTGFCKHMVAVALAANEADAAGAAGPDAVSLVREYLLTRTVAELAEMVVGLAEADPALLRKLETAAAMLVADDKTLEAGLRKVIDSATRAHGYIDYRSARAWAAEVDVALDAVAELVPAGRAAVALKLAARAIERIETALEGADDSDGACGGVLHRACDIHLEAARAAPPDPLALALDLFTRELEGEFEAFDGAAWTYAEVLGGGGAAEYRRLAAAALDQTPARRRPADHESDYRGERLIRILDAFAEADGDLDARISLRSKDLSSQRRYLELAQFCLSQGRKDEALRRAEEGLWVFADGRHDDGLARFTAGLLAKSGRADEGEAMLRKCFERAPDPYIYAELRDVGGKDAAEWAVALLRKRLDRKPASSWGGPADLLVGILTQERAFDDAWEVVRRHGVSGGYRRGLVEASESTHPAEALAAYAEEVAHLADVGGDPAYENAVKLIRRMAGLRGAAEQADYVAELKVRFARKRNFIKLLG